MGWSLTIPLICWQEIAVAPPCSMVLMLWQWIEYYYHYATSITVLLLEWQNNDVRVTKLCRSIKSTVIVGYIIIIVADLRYYNLQCTVGCHNYSLHPWVPSPFHFWHHTATWVTLINLDYKVLNSELWDSTVGWRTITVHVCTKHKCTNLRLDQ